MNFVHLNVHSHYSKGWGLATAEELCKRARDHHMKHIALTDTNSLYGMVSFIKAAKQYGLKPIVGSELVTKDNRAVLLVKDRDGYANLCRIISDCHCDQGFDLIHALRERRSGLVVFSDDFNLLKALKRRFKNDLFVELSPGHKMHAAYAFSRERNIPPVATNRVYLLSSDQFHLHRILRAIFLKKRLSTLQRGDTCLPENTLKSSGEMIDQLPHAPQAVRNTIEIAERCKTDWDFSKIVYPSFRSGLSHEAASLQLREMAVKGCLWRYGEITPEIKSRLKYELKIIGEKGLAQYFLIVADIVKQYPRSCGRGSSAASIISYALGITHIDPVRHNLWFERFLNPSRVEPPDIDLDFAWDERDKILDYVFAAYSNSSVAMVANHNSFGPRLAMHETARVFGLSETEINKAINGIRRKQAFRDSLSPEDLRGPWSKILKEADRIQGKFYCIGTHCGGIVIAPKKIRHYCPVQISSKGMQVLQWEKDSVEETGMVKIDLLGNHSLSVIRDCLSLVYQNYGKKIDYATFNPLTDKEAIKIFYKGDTFGVFYFESPATRQVLSQVASRFTFNEYQGKDHFSINVVITSIIRPASRGVIKTWIQRLHGRPWQHLHPLLKPILEETLGVMVFQEQISQVAMSIAGFNMDEADMLRKIVSKKSKRERLRDCYLRFAKGAKSNGVDNKTINEIWKMIISFDGYSFCKPHSASYTLLAYKCAFLRAHYPAEFMASVISNQGGYYSTLAYISEARRMGLNILPPDINLSEIKYTGKDKWIRIGLMQLKGIPKGTLNALLRERSTNGPFCDLNDFLKRTTLKIHDVLILIKAGCFDIVSNGLSRPALIWKAYRFFNRVNSRKSPDLFSASNVSGPNPLPYNENIAHEHEMDIFGFVISSHPLKLFEKSLRSVTYIPAQDLSRHVNTHVTTVGWPVTEKAIMTKARAPMKFISFEDTTGIYETIFFPDAYRRFFDILGQDRPYIIKGKVEENFGTISLIVNWIGTLKNSAPYRSNALIFHNEQHEIGKQVKNF